jgi:hypothetical protein
MIRNAHKLAVSLLAVVFAACPAVADKIRHPTAVFNGLDKITGRIIVFDVAADETVQFGSLQVTPRACFTRPPTEAPQTTSFVEIEEVVANNDNRKIFNGWMFAASPGLHGVEHPVYDVWLTDCKGGTTVIKETAALPEENLQAPGGRPGTVPRLRQQAAPNQQAVRPANPAPGAPSGQPGAIEPLPDGAVPPPAAAGLPAPTSAPTTRPAAPATRPRTPPPQQAATPAPAVAAQQPPAQQRRPTQSFFPTFSQPQSGADRDRAIERLFDR